MTGAVARPRRNQQPERGKDALEESRSAAGAAAGSNPATAASPAPVSRPHPYELWVEAGGDTEAYDADRYLGLLREHGYARPRKPLTEILVDVLVRAAAPAALDFEPFAATLAPLLTDELGKHGYRIHDVVRCVRPAGPDPVTVGRPMTPEEEAVLLPALASPRPRRRQP